MELRCLGGLSLEAEDGRSLHSVVTQGKRVALLVYLLLARPRGWHARDSLLELFWPDTPRARARRSLSQAVYVLRRPLGSKVILSRGDDALAIAPGTVSCDCLDFDAALERGDVPAALDLYEGSSWRVWSSRRHPRSSTGWRGSEHACGPPPSRRLSPTRPHSKVRGSSPRPRTGHAARAAGLRTTKGRSGRFIRGWYAAAIATAPSGSTRASWPVCEPNSIWSPRPRPSS